MLRWRFWNLGFDLKNLSRSFGHMTRQEFLEASLVPARKGYSPTIWQSEPGTTYQYSNVGLQVLLPYVVE
jgi:hypothetical protein